MTPRVNKVLELSLREALQIGHTYIGTEHILLGLLREGQGCAVAVLRSFGVDPDQYSKFKQAVIRNLRVSVETEMEALRSRWPSTEPEFYAAVAAEALSGDSGLRPEERAVLLVACGKDPGEVEWSTTQLLRAALFASTLPSVVAPRLHSFFYDRLVEEATSVLGNSFCEDFA